MLINIRGFVLQGIGNEIAVKSCDHHWTNKTLELAYLLIWLILLCISLLLMVGFYSIVVHNLWVRPKRHVNKEHTIQKVWIECLKCSKLLQLKSKRFQLIIPVLANKFLLLEESLEKSSCLNCPRAQHCTTRLHADLACQWWLNL